MGTVELYTKSCLHSFVLLDTILPKDKLQFVVCKEFVATSLKLKQLENVDQ